MQAVHLSWRPLYTTCPCPPLCPIWCSIFPAGWSYPEDHQYFRKVLRSYQRTLGHSHGGHRCRFRPPIPRADHSNTGRIIVLKNYRRFSKCFFSTSLSGNVLYSRKHQNVFRTEAGVFLKVSIRIERNRSKRATRQRPTFSASSFLIKSSSTYLAALPILILSICSFRLKAFDCTSNWNESKLSLNVKILLHVK